MTESRGGLINLMISQIIAAPLVTVVWAMNPLVGFLLSLLDIVAVIAWIGGMLKKAPS